MDFFACMSCVSLWYLQHMVVFVDCTGERSMLLFVVNYCCNSPLFCICGVRGMQPPILLAYALRY